MGSNQSTTITDATSILTQNLTTINQDTVNTSGVNCTTVNNVGITNYGTINCAIDSQQESRTICNLVSTFGNQSNEQLISAIQTAVQQTASSDSSAVNQMLATTFSNQGTNMNLSTAIQNYVATNVTMDTFSTCIANSNTLQNGNLVNYGTINCPAGASTITLGQDAQTNLLANCQASTLINLLSQDTAISSTAQSATSTSTAQNQGIASVISSLLSSEALVILASALAIIGVMYIIYKMLANPTTGQNVKAIASVIPVKAP